MKNYQTEHAEQSRLFSWARANQSAIRDLYWLRSNQEGVRVSIGNAVKHKRAGMKPGFPDIELPVERQYYAGLHIEMKSLDRMPKTRGKGGLSDAQAQWLRHLAKQNRCAIVCYGFQDAQDAIVSYLTSQEMKRWEKRTADCVAACIGEEVAA